MGKIGLIKKCILAWYDVKTVLRRVIMHIWHMDGEDDGFGCFFSCEPTPG